MEKESLWGMVGLRKKDSGLPVNIWLDDSMEYKSGGHGYRIKFQPDKGDHPKTRSFTTMTIADEPKVIGETELSAKEINTLKKFVQNNKEALKELSDMEIGFKEFLEKMVLSSKEPLNGVMGKEALWGMATLRKSVTGLPVNIYVDDSMDYKSGGHGKRIKFQPDKGDRPITRNFATMTIANEPKVIGETELSAKEINILKEYVKKNRKILELVADMEIDIFEFKEKMVL